MKRNNGRWRIQLSAPQVIVLSFGVTILVGTLLLSLPAASADGKGIGLLNAYFTASSATCVTGLVVVSTGADLSLFGQLVVLALIQIGGLGLMTMTTFVFLLMGRRITLRSRLLIQESLGQSNLAGLVRLIKSILLFTFISEAVGAILLGLWFSRTMPPLQAAYFGLFHAVSAFCNAGFDLFGDSLVRFASDPVVVIIITALIIAGGLGFLVLRNLGYRRQEGRLTLHTQVVLRTTLALLAVGFVVILLVERDNPGTLGRLPLHGRILSAWFTSVTPRTAGLNVVPTELLRPATLLLMLALMFIGASPGGTGGGIKTTTAWVVLQSVWTTIQGRREIDSAGRSLPREIADRAVAIAAISMGLVLVVAAILLTTESQPFLPVLFETVSAFGTVGLSMGVTPTLSALGRVLIALTMLAGRVGPFTLVVALATRRPPADVHLPEERVLVG
jgi:trk system potassium uptake protein TrkH